jgi:hypothetical protein
MVGSAVFGAGEIADLKISAHTKSMIELAHAHATSTAAPSAFFARWIDHESWTQWDTDTDWVKLDGPVAVGATGVLKPKGGPKTRFTVSALTPDQEYTDTSRMLGATLVFQHRAETVSGRTELEARVTLEGALARLWAAILGAGFAESVPAALNRLVELVESQACGPAR